MPFLYWFLLQWVILVYELPIIILISYCMIARHNLLARILVHHTKALRGDDTLIVVLMVNSRRGRVENQVIFI